MDKMSNGDIDLFSILEIIWNDKRKIFFTVFFCIMVSFAYIFYIPSLFKATTTVQMNKNDLYFKFKQLNDILNSELIQMDDKEPIFLLNNNRIVEMFINEFNDYNEIINSLSENEYVTNKVESLDEKEKRAFLISLAKNFTIIPNNSDQPLKISFRWHDINEGILIFNRAIDVTLINVKNTLLEQIDDIVKSIDFKNNNKKASLNAELEANRTLKKLLNAKRITYLTEQYNIAKELNLEKNQLISFTKMNTHISGENLDSKFQSESYDYPYYLRGFKAINKEIEMIKNRSINENDLMTEGYFKIKQKLLIIDSDDRSKELLRAREIINKEKATEWLNFNFELAETENLKNSQIYISIAIMIGLFFGIFYVLMSNTFKQRKNF